MKTLTKILIAFILVAVAFLFVDYYSLDVQSLLGSAQPSISGAESTVGTVLSSNPLATVAGIGSLGSIIAAIANAYAQAQQTITTLKSDKSQLLGSTQTLQSQLDKTTSDAKSAADSLTTQLANQTSVVQGLNGQLSTAQATIQSQTQQLSAANGQVTSLTGQVSAAQTTVQNQASKIQQLEQHIKDLEDYKSEVESAVTAT